MYGISIKRARLVVVSTHSDGDGIICQFLIMKQDVQSCRDEGTVAG